MTPRTMLRLHNVLILLSIATMMSAVSQAGEMVEFSSEAGRFKIHLPAEPSHEVTEVGNAKEKQHQFTVGVEKGAYIISYQDNPNLEGRDAKGLAAALDVGRDHLIKVFDGKLLESKPVATLKKYHGLDFRVTIPQAHGEARCRFYMVGTRLYQIIAVGEPQFANSDQATQVIDSFKLLEK